MTLMEKMMELDPEEIMFIGSATGFFFIGNSYDFVNHIDQCLKESSITVNAERLHDLKCELADKKYRLSHGHIISQNVPRTNKRIISLEKWIPVWERQIKEAQDPKNTAPIRERQVIESYRRFHNDGTVIIIDGVEIGRYWFYEDTAWGKNKESD